VSIADNVARVEAAVSQSCRAAGRARSEITLVAVTKTRTALEVDEAVAAGITDVGENRVQEALAKKPLVSRPAHWHLIGTLQTNKARRAVELFDSVQSVDSERLAGELDRRCTERKLPLPVLIEVNTSAEPSKHGVPPAILAPLIEAVTGCTRLRLDGLMTIGPGLAVGDPEASRPCFALLRRLAEENRARFGIALAQLSMGMSADYAIGIEEGATVVRIGTALFGARAG
jgi:pyridoxal phosphate enzyme (YggS family)